jgi:hypothetical protein
MKRKLFVAAIVLTSLFSFSSTALADGPRGSWSFGFGFGSGGAHFGGGFRVGRGYHGHGRFHRVCHHRPIPIYTRVWVAPVYDTVFSGYDHCGRPIYRRVVTCRGYWQNVVSGYRCGLCSAPCG